MQPNKKEWPMWPNKKNMKGGIRKVFWRKIKAIPRGCFGFCSDKIKNNEVTQQKRMATIKGGIWKL